MGLYKKEKVCIHLSLRKVSYMPQHLLDRCYLAEGKQIDEKVEVGNGKSMTEPQYYQPQHANGLENGSMPAAWAPARLARRLFEQSAAEGPVPSQRPKSGATPGDFVTVLRAFHALRRK